MLAGARHGLITAPHHGPIDVALADVLGANDKQASLRSPRPWTRHG
ncbi:hypothetical protein FAIPA1_40121 [Frankia sp. AiPs1]